MTTKAKCFELANEHGLTITYSFRGYEKSSSVDLPDGFQDYDGRTGLCFETYEQTAKDFWKAVYGDIEQLVMMKDRWTQIERELVSAWQSHKWLLLQYAS